MSLQEQACQLIYDLPDDKVEAVIHVLIAMIPVNDLHENQSMKEEKDISSRRNAFHELMQLREEFASANIDISEEVMQETLREKYGVIA